VKPMMKYEKERTKGKVGGGGSVQSGGEITTKLFTGDHCLSKNRSSNQKKENF